jgi:hypothetical protein
MPFQLLDMKGAPVLQGNFRLSPDQPEARIGTSGLKAGIYLLKISGKSAQMTQKIILQ